MTRLTIVVEGQTEESFVNNILGPALWAGNILTTPILLGRTGHKGGNVNYARVRRDLLLQLKQDRTAYCSTMFDLYRLGSGFPGTPCLHSLTGSQKAERIEAALLEDIMAQASELRADLRFIPYLQVHEFEALLFSEPATLSAALGREVLKDQLTQIRSAVRTPEDIDDGPYTAPSKRILGLHPAYQKIIEGTLAATEIGLEKMRLECPHFHAWVSRLGSLSIST